MIREQEEKQVPFQQEADRIEIIYYTDPLCCWSWAFEPHWRKFQYIFRDIIQIKIRMGGLIKDWNSFDDPLNSIRRPSQMGPMWMEAKHLSGMPLNEIVWIQNPPSTSYLACIAVKAAQLQSDLAASLLLRKLQEAVMMNGRNISRKEVILEITAELCRTNPGILNEYLFNKQFMAKESADAFREDLEKVRIHQIGRFPTLTFQKPGGKGVMITGFRPFPVLCDALKALQVDLTLFDVTITKEEYVKFYGSLTDRELQEI